MFAHLSKVSDTALLEGNEDCSARICKLSYKHDDKYGKEGKRSGKQTDQGGHKRKLERDRRNLINARFDELAIELQRNEDGDTGDRRFIKRPKIDKEAILKEAVMRLIVQRKEITTTMARLNDLLAQVDIMRIEMEDLRTDKSFLYADIQQLSESNKRFWTLICDASMTTSAEVKDALPVNTNHTILQAPDQTQPKETCTPLHEMTSPFAFGSLIPSIKNATLTSMKTLLVQPTSASKQLFGSASDVKQSQNKLCGKSLIFGAPMTAAQDCPVQNNAAQAFNTHENLENFDSGSRPSQNEITDRRFLSQYGTQD